MEPAATEGRRAEGVSRYHVGVQYAQDLVARDGLPPRVQLLQRVVEIAGLAVDFSMGRMQPAT